MAAKKVDFTEILIRQGVDQGPTNWPKPSEWPKPRAKSADQLVILGYATGDEVMRAMAKEHGLDFVDLNEVGHSAVDRRACPNRWPAKTPSCRWPRRMAR